MVEGGHGAVGAEVANSTLELLLGLGGLGPGLEHVLFGLGLSNLALEGGEASLQGVHLAGLGADLAIQRRGGVLVGLAAREGIAGELLFTLFQGQLGAVVPGCGLALGLFRLILQAFLAGDGGGHGLAEFHQVGLHVSHRLVEDLARILCLADEVVEVGAQQAAKPIKKAHGWWGHSIRG